ncbi:myosin-2 heavy chain-like isoform X1 [Haliotis rubra]|uniref:myosin-2 heavy chain-like isoform X1 n=2 Tax=Haliotis rubra TaxID=36100 RepID=UPI001EE5A2C1|nr:myosin-2 heavy chain-like isoform X1 [Haliotis rubra]
MDPRKQATLMNYHQAIEDTVDLDKVMPEMEDIFTQHEKRDINHTKGKDRMRRFVDIVASKDDAAFDALVKAVRRDNRKLATRLVQGVKDEDMRLKQAGDGVKQKIALALLTTRISERQKETIISNVSEVVDSELHSKALRVSIPDHRASAELDQINTKLKKIINLEVDPLLYGPGYRTDLSQQEADEVVSKLQSMLVELNVIQDCYSALGVHAFSGSGKALPNILCQRIEETKTSIGILQKEKKDLSKEKADLVKEKSLQGKDVGTLESRNRSLELHNRNLEGECAKLDQAVKKLTSVKDSLEIEKRKLQDENSKLVSTNQGLQTEAWNLGLNFKRADELNQKLTRENQKLSSKNNLIKREYYGPSSTSSLKADNKTLLDDKLRLKAEIGKLEGEKRQLLIRTQKLDSENDNLRDQKRKLMIDKRKYWGENQQLKTEAKRLAIGTVQPVLLPPIAEVQGSKGSLMGSNQQSGKGYSGQVGHNGPERQTRRTNNHSPPHSKSSPGVGIPARKSVNSNTFTSPQTGSRKTTTYNSSTGKSQLNHPKYRASVYDYRPQNKSVQFNTSPPPRYGNKA